MSDQERYGPSFCIKADSENEFLYSLFDDVHRIAWLSEADLDALMQALLNTKHFADKKLIDNVPRHSVETCSACLAGIGHTI